MKSSQSPCSNFAPAHSLTQTIFVIAFSLLLALPSCSSGDRRSDGPSEQDKISASNGDGLETLVVMGTNDIHGALAPMSLKTRDSAAVPYQAGGVAYLASYVQTLRSRFGDHFIWLDGGDEFQGTIESNTEKGKPMVLFFNKMGLNAAAVGNHEFDYGPETPESPDKLGALKARMLEAHYPYVASNIYEKGTHERPPFPNTYPHTMLTAGRLKVGVIGLSTIDTPRTTRAENVQSLDFGPLKEATLREAKALREEGANVVLITAHAGTKCEHGRGPIGNTVRTSTDPQGECDDEEMVQLLRSLPTGTVDGVVAGHTHQVIHHWIAGTPVIEGGANGRYFNVMYLVYDWKTHKLLTDRTRIEGPVPVCPQVFENQNDCNGDRVAPHEGRGALVTPKFHGETIRPNSEVQAMLDVSFAKSAELKKQVFGQAARPIEPNRTAESALGDLVADSVRAAAHADIAVVNSGGIRAPLESGPITYGDIFRVLPFDNAISVIKMSGKELRLMIRIAESGSRGVFPSSGLKLTLISSTDDAPSNDLNGDGKIDTWEINRILDVRLADDNPIQDKKMYTVATIDFLVTGGDDLGWFMKQLPAERIQLDAAGLMRDGLATYVRTLSAAGPINSLERPIVDPTNPRVKFEKVKKATKKHRKRRRKS